MGLKPNKKQGQYHNKESNAYMKVILHFVLRKLQIEVVVIREQSMNIPFKAKQILSVTDSITNLNI